MVVALAVGALTGLSAPAYAAPVAIGTVADLQTGLASCTDTLPTPYEVTLTADLENTTAELVVACDARIDLAGNDLKVRNIVLNPTKSLEVTDTTPVAVGPDPNADAGTLTADARGASRAGIRTSGATLITSGTAQVTAVGGMSSAGIGGSIGGLGGTTSSSDTSTITATGGLDGAGIGGGFNGDGGTTTSYGASTITATGGDYAAGIGGGNAGNGGITTIAGESVVVATGNASASAVGAGGGGNSPWGTVLNVSGGTLLLGSDLFVPDTPGTPEVAISDGGTIARSTPAGSAGITGTGTISNYGAIALPTAAVDTSTTLVTGHHYVVTFDTQGGSTAPAPVTVFANTFAHGDRALPPHPTQPGTEFLGWNTAANGTGTTINQRTGLPGASAGGTAQPITLHAQYGDPAADLDDLRVALAGCDDTLPTPYEVELSTALDDTTAVLVVGCDARIDLAGHDLDVLRIVVNPTVSLEVTDSTPVAAGPDPNIDAGTLNANPHNAYTGIQTSDASLITSGTAKVVATGGINRAGIGGTDGGGAADGGTVTSNDTSTITATGGDAAAGIGGGSSGDGGTVTSNDASTITATGGIWGAGIGGGWGGDGGTTDSNDTSTITATGGNYGAGIGGGWGGDGGTTTSNDTSTITATGGDRGAGIGGGLNGTGGSTTIADNSTITATAGNGASAVGAGDAGTPAAGTFLNVAGGTLFLGSDLDVPDAAGTPEVVVGAGGVIARRTTPASTAAITGAGTISNDGAITLPTAAIDTSTTSVTGHHYLATFDTHGGSAAPAPVTVFADTFVRGDRVLPPDPTKPGQTFRGWNTAADGTGTTIGASTTLPGASSGGTAEPITLHAQYRSPTPTPTPTVTSLTPPQVTGARRYDTTLTATEGTWTGNPTTITFQWLRDDTPIPGADVAEYRTTLDDVGHTLSVQVTATSATSSADVTVTAGEIRPARMTWTNTERLTLTGKTKPGRKLRGSITKNALLTSTAPTATRVTYQWRRDGKPITDGTRRTHRVRHRDLGHRIKLFVTLTRPGHRPLTLRTEIVRPRR